MIMARLSNGTLRRPRDAIGHAPSITMVLPRRHQRPVVPAPVAGANLIPVGAAASSERLTPGMLRRTAAVNAERTTLSGGPDPSVADSSRTALRRTRTMRRAFSMSACPGSMPSYSSSSALAAARPSAPPIMDPTPGIGMNEPSAVPAMGSATLASDFRAGKATLPTALSPRPMPLTSLPRNCSISYSFCTESSSMASSSSSCSDTSLLPKDSYSNSNSPVPADRHLGHLQLIGCMIASIVRVQVRGRCSIAFGRAGLRSSRSEIAQFEKFQFLLRVQNCALPVIDAAAAAAVVPTDPPLYLANVRLTTNRGNIFYVSKLLHRHKRDLVASMINA